MTFSINTSAFFWPDITHLFTIRQRKIKNFPPNFALQSLCSNFANTKKKTVILTTNIFKQTNAYAMQLGGIFGLYWCIGLFCLIAGFKVPVLSSFSLLIILSAPIMGIALARHFENQVRTDGPVYYGRAYLFSFLMYFYATILLAGITYIYFSLFDNGAFIEANIAYMQRPEMREFMDSPDVKIQMQNMLAATGYKSLEEFLRSISPIMITANIVDANLIFAVVLSFPTALISQTRINSLLKK